MLLNVYSRAYFTLLLTMNIAFDTQEDGVERLFVVYNKWDVIKLFNAKCNAEALKEFKNFGTNIPVFPQWIALYSFWYLALRCNLLQRNDFPVYLPGK